MTYLEKKTFKMRLFGGIEYKVLEKSFGHENTTPFFILGNLKVIYLIPNIKKINEYIENRKSLPNNLKDKLFDTYFSEVFVRDVWDCDYTKPMISGSSQYLGYPTQKPEGLFERILRASSNEGDLVADFFCGSGSTLAVAEKLGRKWIGSDLGKFGVHTSRKRLIGVQRELKKAGKNFRAFEILNVGRYEREN